MPALCIQIQKSSNVTEATQAAGWVAQAAEYAIPVWPFRPLVLLRPLVPLMLLVWAFIPHPKVCFSFGHFWMGDVPYPVQYNMYKGKIYNFSRGAEETFLPRTPSVIFFSRRPLNFLRRPFQFFFEEASWIFPQGSIGHLIVTFSCSFFLEWGLPKFVFLEKGLWKCFPSFPLPRSLMVTPLVSPEALVAWAAPVAWAAWAAPVSWVASVAWAAQTA